jgi:pyrroloquinoline quinone (PQQ) biosynthesis protein C
MSIKSKRKKMNEGEIEKNQIQNYLKKKKITIKRLKTKFDRLKN